MAYTADNLAHLSQIGLTAAPVAVAFLTTPPAGLPHIGKLAAARCRDREQAAGGPAFYTTPEDHGNCPVGAFTHGVELSPAKSEELQSLVGTMIELKYLKSDEI